MHWHAWFCTRCERYFKVPKDFEGTPTGCPCCTATARMLHDCKGEGIN